MDKKPFVELRRCRSEVGAPISCRVCYDDDYEIYLSCLKESSEKLWEGLRCEPQKLDQLRLLERAKSPSQS